jgi:hypothetical protein
MSFFKAKALSILSLFLLLMVLLAGCASVGITHERTMSLTSVCGLSKVAVCDRLAGGDERCYCAPDRVLDELFEREDDW